MTLSITCELTRFNAQVLQTTAALRELSKVFKDRDRWFTVTPGQWPDEFVLLNRFVRTGLRPPFIFND